MIIKLSTCISNYFNLLKYSEYRICLFDLIKKPKYTSHNIDIMFNGHDFGIIILDTELGMYWFYYVVWFYFLLSTQI